HSCYACHKDLEPDRASWKALNASNHPPGAMPWGTWATPILPALPGADSATLQAVRSLRELMESPAPSPKKVETQCQTVLRQLDQWLAQMEKDKSITDVAPLRTALAGNALTADGKQLNDLDWDGAVQHYLGLAALQYAAGKQSFQAPL